MFKPSKAGHNKLQIQLDFVCIHRSAPSVQYLMCLLNQLVVHVLLLEPH